VVGVLPRVGTLLTELVPGGHLAGDRLGAALDTIVDLVATFHRSGPLAGSFPIHRVVEAHARDAAAHGVPAPAVYAHLHDASRRIEAAMAEHSVDAVPCHNDLLPANLLFDGGRAWLLDFEYAGMNDPFFDLGNLAVNCAFDAPTERRLVERYLGGPSASGDARLALMKVMSELREGMWAVVQQAISTLDEDFAGYAASRLESCRRLVDDPSFEVWLDAARAPL
jgi:thiamine kinase-like enzyme